MAMYYGLHVGGGAALSEVDGARKIGETAEALGYDSIVTGDHITIPKKIDSTYPYVDAAQARGQDPYSVFTSMEWNGWTPSPSWPYSFRSRKQSGWEPA